MHRALPAPLRFVGLCCPKDPVSWRSQCHRVIHARVVVLNGRDRSAPPSIRQRDWVVESSPPAATRSVGFRWDLLDLLQVSLAHHRFHCNEALQRAGDAYVSPPSFAEHYCPNRLSGWLVLGAAGCAAAAAATAAAASHAECSRRLHRRPHLTCRRSCARIAGFSAVASQ